MAQFMEQAFKSWSHGKGTVDKRRFTTGLSGVGLHFSKRQLDRVFRVMDPDQVVIDKGGAGQPG